MNKVVLLGRLTRDVELREAGATKVTQFSLAVDKRFKKEGEQNADFINCVAWDKTAEFINKYFKKGNKLAITGRLQTRNYDDKDGKKVYVTEVVVEETYFCEHRQNDNQVVDDDLPF